MTADPIPCPSRLSSRACACVLGLVLAACGGGDGDGGGDASVAASKQLSPPAPRDADVPFVMVEGCVLDRHYIPHTGTPVRALSADGRLLANALSDGDGRFTLRLPAQAWVTLAVDRPDGDTQPLHVGAAPVPPGACLLDEQA